MATNHYDYFLAPQQNRGEIEYNTLLGDVNYPDKDQVSIFGPIYVPRVYGKDLTAFEIASSGSVAVTLNDIHSFDLQRDNATSNVTLKTYDQDSFTINVENSKMTMDFSKVDGVETAKLYSFGKVGVEAGGLLQMEASSVTVDAVNGCDVTAKNASVVTSSNILLTGQEGFVKLSASNASSTLDLANQDISMFAQHDISAKAENDVFVAATKNVKVTASNESLELSAQSGQMKLKLDHLSSNISLEGAKNLDVLLSKKIDIKSAVDSIFLSAASEKVKVSLDAATSNLSLLADKDVSVVAHQAMSLSADATYSVLAGGAASVTTASTLALSASNAMSLLTQDAFSLQSAKDTSCTAGEDMQFVAASNVSIQAQSKSLALSADTGKVLVTLDDSTSSLLLATAHDISGTASNNISFVAGKSGFMNAASNLEFVGESNVVLKRDAENIISIKKNNFIEMKAAEEIDLYAGGVKVLSATSNELRVDGNLRVTGVIDSVDIHQSNLMVTDRTINLAYDSELGSLPDGADTNSGAGIIVAGQYGSASNARSLTWNWGVDGMSKLGSAEADKESFWDLRGGHLRISHSNATNDVAFAFRINQYNELELIKITGGNTYKRIAKFGRTL